MQIIIIIFIVVRRLHGATYHTYDAVHMPTQSYDQYHLIIRWYLHVWNEVAVAAYIRLTSRSQAKFQNNRNWVTFQLPCAAAPAQSTVSACRSLDSCWAASSQRVPGHCYSVPCMKIPANNKVIFIKNVVAVAAYRSCRLWRWEKMSCATTTGPSVDIPSAIQPMSCR